MTTISYPCEGCGIEVTRAIGDEGRRRFCSVRCARQHQIMASLEQRYWKKVVVKEVGCWGWIGATSKFGYGILRSGPRGQSTQSMAHRIGWAIHNGPVPEGLNVCHVCDNPPCTRPDHLFIGDDSANMRDRDVKGRHGTAKLVPRDIRSIRARRAQGEKLRSIAADFGMSVGQIHAIVSRRAWRHVE